MLEKINNSQNQKKDYYSSFLNDKSVSDFDIEEEQTNQVFVLDS